MTSLAWHLRYEITALRHARWLPWLFVGLLAVAVGMTIIVGLSLDAYYDFGSRLRWAALITQGGIVGWPPLFAFFLALLGVLMWGQDCGGESSYVAFATFPDRWKTGLVRTALLTVASAAISLGNVVVSVVLGALLFEPGSVSANIGLIGIKSLWVVVCGVAFAHLGAFICVLSRSALTATGLLLVVPWVVEPILVELSNLASSLSWLGPALRFLPFRVAGDVIGSPDLEASGWAAGGQLVPLAAAITAAAYVTVAVLAVQWRYCRADAS